MTKNTIRVREMCCYDPLVVDTHVLRNENEVLTPALLIYPDRVQANISAALKLMDGDARRWRPHVKTVKMPQVTRMLLDNGVQACKCATTLELQMCCEQGVPDVLFAMPAVGATLRRVAEIARDFPGTRVSFLVESEAHLSELDVFIDINPGMNRTGLQPERAEEIVRLARAAGSRFRGLHFYDGHLSSDAIVEAHAGYSALFRLVETLGLPVGEVITSGTPAAIAGLRYQAFRKADFLHRVSPGTIVFSDGTSLRQLPELGFVPAVLVLATVISHPAPGVVTCDAGHKSVSVDAGVPNCSVVGRPELEPLRPSEEHLPIRVPDGVPPPAIGEVLYLLPRHICPTVNLFDQALAVTDGVSHGTWQIRARGHESRGS